MADPHSVFGWALAYSDRIQAAAERARRILVLSAGAERRCGTCRHWMRSSSCPREVLQADGRYRGPDCAGWPCAKYEPTPEAIAAACELRSELSPLQAQGEVRS